jgi:hypothetical protein
VNHREVREAAQRAIESYEFRRAFDPEGMVALVAKQQMETHFPDAVIEEMAVTDARIENGILKGHATILLAPPSFIEINIQARTIAPPSD